MLQARRHRIVHGKLRDGKDPGTLLVVQFNFQRRTEYRFFRDAIIKIIFADQQQSLRCRPYGRKITSLSKIAQTERLQA